MRRHNDLSIRRGFRNRSYLTERQFLRFSVRLEEDIMTKRQMVYAKFEGLEERLAHCYFMLHERFIANPPLAKFWAEAAMEELQHHSILRYCREHGLMADVDVDVRTAEQVEDLLETVKGIVADPDISVDEGYYAALLMESSEMEEVYEKLIGSLSDKHRLLYDAIQASLRSHHSGFAESAERFCGDRGLAEAFRNLPGRAS